MAKSILLIMIYVPRNKKLKSVSIEHSIICGLSVCTFTVFPVEICLNVGKKILHVHMLMMCFSLHACCKITHTPVA